MGERDMVADGPEGFQFSVLRSVDHLHQVQARSAWNRRTPYGFECIPSLLDGYEAGEIAGFAAHVGGALHIILATEWIHTAAGFAKVAGEKCEINQTDHPFGTLHVFGH